MTFLTRYIRYIVLIGNFILGFSIFLYVFSTIPEGSLRIIRLVETYALLALTFLYFSLLVSPFYSAFPTLPLRGLMVKARRATGVSAYFYSLTHASFAFFGLLGGFEGLQYLDSKYLLAITLSFTALIILSVMALISFDRMVNKLGRTWKTISRFVYLAALLITIHALMLGSHFQDLNGLIPQIFLVLGLILLVLEAVRLDKYLTAKHNFPHFGISLAVVLALTASFFTYVLVPAGALSPLGIHTQHQNIAQQNQQSQNSALPNNPGLVGDRTKRYTASFATAGELGAGKEVTLKFKIYDANTGNEVKSYSLLYEKLMHLIVVDSSLNYFSHIHPELNGAEFSITHNFPTDGIYHLYIDFQPLGAIEQQLAFTLTIGEGDNRLATQPVDSDFAKTFGDYQVTLEKTDFSAAKMTLGTQLLTFTLKDKEGKDVTNLRPYLAAFGHLVMIKQDTYDYSHVHPTPFTPPLPDALGGPKVEFYPLGLYAPVKPGIYRVFGQFNPDGKLFTADFTINVK